MKNVNFVATHESDVAARAHQRSVTSPLLPSGVEVVSSGTTSFCLMPAFITQQRMSVYLFSHGRGLPSRRE